MKKKLLTLDDLYNFCQSNNLQHFSSKEYGKCLRVQVPGQFSKLESDETTLYSDIKICHTGKNRNGSNLKQNAANHCMKTLAYKPLLANFTDVNGEWDFTSHDMYEVENEDGEKEMIYEEKQIGCFTADKPYMKYDEEYGHDYMYGRVAIPREYTKAAEIIERKGGTKVSVELEILEMSFNAKEKTLDLDDAIILGCTCLGVDPDTGKEIGEGMVDSHISLESFSANENSIFTEELINELKKFNSNFETLNSNKQGGQDNMNLFEELLAKYEVTEDQVKFDYSEMSDEELKKAFQEAFGEESEGGEEPGTEPEENAEENEENLDAKVEGEEGSEVEEDDNAEGDESEETEDESDENKNEYSLTLPDGNVKNFSLSLSDIEDALCTLVNDTYAEIDNDYYLVDVYGDDSKVVMVSWYSGKAYRQNYKRKKDAFTLEGERVPVTRQWLSEDEEKVLESMKSNYSVIEDKLAKYEAEPEKVELLNSEEYEGIKNTDEYAEISKRENYFELDKEDLAKKLDEITLSYAKAHKLDFSENNKSVEEKKVAIKPLFGGSVKGVGRYGGVFSKNK